MPDLSARSSLIWWSGAVALGVMCACGEIAVAQVQQPASAVAAPPVKPAKTTATPAAASKPTKNEGGPAGPSDTALRSRVDHLEEQLVDMQVLVGTLESLARSNGAASASSTYRSGGAVAEGGPGGADQARVAGLESQVRALTSQVQQLSEQVRSLNAQPRRSDAVQPGPAPVSGFGTATVSPARADPIDGLLAGQGTGDTTVAALPAAASAPVGDGGNPKQLYETAYGYLLQQDYGAAETAFDEFLKRYPSDALAGNAQFWLGESFFVRGQYKPAASAFLKGYQTYGKSAKAPDSLLKLAMSLGRLGQKDAACSSFAELGTRFPSASNDVKTRAMAEKQRSGCI